MNPLDWASVSESPHKSSRVSDWKVTAANMTHSTFHSIASSSSLVILSSFTPSLPAFLLTLCSCSFPVALPWPLLCVLFLGLLLPLRFSSCFSPAHLALFCILSLSVTTLLPSSMHHSHPLLYFYLFRISVFSSYCYLLHSFLFLHSSPLSRSLSESLAFPPLALCPLLSSFCCMEDDELETAVTAAIGVAAAGGREREKGK